MKKVTNYELDDKINNFIKWYQKNIFPEDYYVKDSVFQEGKKLLSFIDKMAIWYELRYPEYEINRIIPGSNQELKDVNEEMILKNDSINMLIKQFNEKVDIKWSDFYNYDRFLNSLPLEEASYLDQYYYNNLIYIENNSFSHIHLNNEGIITDVDDFLKSLSISGHVIFEKDIIGLNLFELIKYLNKYEIKLPKNNGIELEIARAFKHNYFRNELLNCVMYKIIERGGNRIGPRRGLMFAKEFKTNKNIPMKYGVDFSDPGLHLLIQEYLKLGGNLALDCLINYYNRDKKNKFLRTIKLYEVLERFEMHYLNALEEGFTILPLEEEKYQFASTLLEREAGKIKVLKK